MTCGLQVATPLDDVDHSFAVVYLDSLKSLTFFWAQPEPVSQWISYVHAALTQHPV